MGLLDIRGHRSTGGESSSHGTMTGASTSANKQWDLVAADDPTDWKEQFGFLRHLDTSLRCELCYDIFTAPVSIRDCGHTFCSACIRSAINKPGEEMGSCCPKCMKKNVYDSSLLPQPTLENAAQQWRLARQALFTMQQERQTEDAAKAAAAASHATQRPTKRPKLEVPSSSTSPPGIRRSSRSRTGKSPSYVDTVTLEDTTEGEEEEEDDVQEGSASPPSTSPAPQTNGTSKDYREISPGDLVQCPMCQHMFTYRALNIHLDKGTCQPGDPEPSPLERGLTGNGVHANGSAKSWLAASSTQAPSQPRLASSDTNATPAKRDKRKKLVRPNYDMLKPVDLKRALTEAGLSTAGGQDRKRLVERHRKWINLYNANLDASERMRKSDNQLRQDLQRWERAQEEAMSGLSEKRAKTWATEHRDDFADLARKARESHLRDRAKHAEEKKAADGGEGAATTTETSSETEARLDPEEMPVPPTSSTLATLGPSDATA